MHSFCLISGTGVSTKARAAAMELEQPPALKMRRSNAVQTRRLALRMGLLERHMAVLESERLRAVRQLHQELRHLHVPVRSVTLSPRHAQVLHDAGDDDLLEGTAHDAQGHASCEHDNHYDHYHQHQHQQGKGRGHHHLEGHTGTEGGHAAADVLRIHRAEAPLESIEGCLILQQQQQELPDQLQQQQPETEHGSSDENADSCQKPGEALEGSSKVSLLASETAEDVSSSPSQQVKKVDDEAGESSSNNIDPAREIKDTKSNRDNVNIKRENAKITNTKKVNRQETVVLESLRIDTTTAATSRKNSLISGTLGGFQIPASTMKKRGLIRLQQRRGSGPLGFLSLQDAGEPLDVPVKGRGIIHFPTRSNTYVTASGFDRDKPTNRGLGVAGGAARTTHEGVDEETAKPSTSSAADSLVVPVDSAPQPPNGTIADHQPQSKEAEWSSSTADHLQSEGHPQPIRDTEGGLNSHTPIPAISPRWAKKAPLDKLAGRRYNRLCPLLPAPTAASTSAIQVIHHHHHHHQQQQQHHTCSHFPCVRPDTYHSLGFHPDASSHPWRGWQVQNARRPHHRLDPHRPPDPMAYANGPPPTPGDAPGYMKRKRLGKEEVIKMDMARKKEAHAQARPPSWNTNYGQPVPIKRLKYPVRLNPMF